MRDESADMRAEIAMLKDKVAELIHEHNLMSGYLEMQRREMGKHMTYPWYRFIVWLWPLPYPPYARRIVVNQFRNRDRRPVLRAGDGDDRGATFDSKPRKIAGG